MELMAAIQGFLAVREACEIEVTTASEYVFDGITDRITNWKRRNWQAVANTDLWLELDGLVAVHETTWIRQTAHEESNRCESLARNAALRQTSSWPDNRPHERLPLSLGRSYVHPKPKAIDVFDVLGLGENGQKK
jgi:ribonuclease HI